MIVLSAFAVAIGIVSKHMCLMMSFDHVDAAYGADVCAWYDRYVAD